MKTTPGYTEWQVWICRTLTAFTGFWDFDLRDGFLRLQGLKLRSIRWDSGRIAAKECTLALRATSLH